MDCLSLILHKPILFFSHSFLNDNLSGTSGKEPTRQCRRHKKCRFDPCVGKISWRRNDNPLQYSRLENPLDRGAWQAMVHRVTKSQRQLKWVMMDIWSISFKRVALIFSLLEYGLGEFPGGPVVRILHFHCRGLGFDPCWGTKIPKAMWRGLKKRKD